MIIFSNKPGQLGNMLFIYANLLAYGLEHRIKIANPAFNDYQGYFRGTHQRPEFFSGLRYKLSFYAARILDKLKFRSSLLSANCLDWSESFDLDRDGKQLNASLCFLQGWQYRAPQSTRKHEAQIRSFFAPAETYAKTLDAFFEKHFTGEEVVIAVHIRRGDYKHFEGGKYFYEIGQYQQVMQQAAALFAGKSIHFLICSNETVHMEKLHVGGSRLSMAPNHELLDMYSMARCHYIIGPPSTYSMWASVYGQVPLCQLREPGSTLTIQDFAVHSSF